LELFEVVQTVGLLGFGFGSAKGRQEKRREDPDDGNHDQKFNECEATAISPSPSETRTSPSRCFERLCIHAQDKLSQVVEICQVLWGENLSASSGKAMELFGGMNQISQANVVEGESLG